MTRTDFIKACGIFGVGLVAPCIGFGHHANRKTSEQIIIIGAGAGGLSAGYLLQQQGIDFQILEASSTYGGRMKRTTDFADFPIPLGAEWLHTTPHIFEEIVHDDSVKVDVPLTQYNPAVDYGWYEGKRISVAQAGFKKEYKFINTTWFDFFETYIVPSIKSKIRYRSIVKSIDYSQDKIVIQTENEEFIADKVIISVPLKMLQDKFIHFTPDLPKNKQKAIKNITVWDGFKAFIQFSTSFYPTFTEFKIKPYKAGQKLYYDASYGQNTTQNILGLFTVGTGTQPYRSLSDEDLMRYMLQELDDIFDGQATPNYIQHTSQNWNKEPFIRGAYVYDHESWRRVRTLGKSIENKVFFAGDAYTNGFDWGSVDTAIKSAQRAVNELLQ